MQKDAENMNLNDAIDSIKYHFTEPGGLLSRIEQGEKVDERDIHMIQISLQRIRSGWGYEQCVPKNVVKMFIDGISKLDHYARNSKNRLTEITNFSMELSSWINDIFSAESMTEEQALSLFVQHVFGTPPFIIELRQRRIDDDSVAELSASLAALSQFWLGRKDIPKLAAHALFNTKDLLITANYMFTGKEQEKLENIEEKLNPLIEQCLT